VSTHFFFKDWGFKLEDLKCKIKLFWGEDDGGCTPVMGRYLASKIPNCETNFVKDKGHLLFFDVWDEMISWLLERAKEHDEDKGKVREEEADKNTSTDPKELGLEPIEKKDKKKKKKKHKSKESDSTETSSDDKNDEKEEG